MNKTKRLLKQVIENNVLEIVLDQITPIELISFEGLTIEELNIKIYNSYENKYFKEVDYRKSKEQNSWYIHLENVMLKHLKFEIQEINSHLVDIQITYGDGFIAVLDEEWTNLFHREQRWVGGDGIFSIHLDGYDLPSNVGDTLFVFGDTFVGSIHPKSRKRLQPHLMLNNTFALLKNQSPVNENIQFLIKESQIGGFESYVVPETDQSMKGSMIGNLTYINHINLGQNWLSNYYPSKIELIFDFQDLYEIDQIDIYNYYIDDPIVPYSKRGMRKVSIYTSIDSTNWKLIDGDEWKFLEEADLNKSGENFTSFRVNRLARYIKIVGYPKVSEGNFGGINGEESLYGLRSIRFKESSGRYLVDVRGKSNTEYSRERINNWYWMQDGIRIENRIYFFPLVISPFDGPEGYSFQIDNITMIEIPIEDKIPQFEKIRQTDTPLFYKTENGSEWIYGAAILDNRQSSNPINGDGFIYVYGYRPQKEFGNACRELLCARVDPQKFPNFNEWRFWDGENWQSNYLSATAFLSHVSCEMSVSPILNGKFKGKYIAVFQYDVNSNYVAYAIGDTPIGPFSEPKIIYYCDEILKDNRITTYNAKAHPHLSDDKGLLVSYNVNTVSDELNASNGDIYRPRFLRFREI